MAATVNWIDDSKTVLFQNYTGLWTLEDFYRMVDATYSLMDEVRTPVDTIVNLSESVTLTANLITTGNLSPWSYASARAHRNQRYVVFVGASLLMKTVIQVAHKSSRNSRNIMFVETMDEAYDLLNLHSAPPPVSKRLTW